MIQAGFPSHTEWGLDFIFRSDPQGTRQDGTIVVEVRITLKPGRDDDLIALVLSTKKLAPAIREAMPSGVIKGSYTQLGTNIDDLQSTA